MNEFCTNQSGSGFHVIFTSRDFELGFLPSTYITARRPSHEQMQAISFIKRNIITHSTQPHFKSQSLVPRVFARFHTPLDYDITRSRRHETHRPYSTPMDYYNQYSV